jgi:hypothetical protein
MYPAKEQWEKMYKFKFLCILLRHILMGILFPAQKKKEKKYLGNFSSVNKFLWVGFHNDKQENRSNMSSAFDFVEKIV